MYTYIHTIKPPSSLSLCMCSEPSLRCQPNDSTSRVGLAIHLLHCPSDRDEVWPWGDYYKSKVSFETEVSQQGSGQSIRYNMCVRCI